MDIKPYIEKLRNIIQGREPFLRLARNHWILIIILALLMARLDIFSAIAWCVPFYLLVFGSVTIERREKINLPLKYLQIKQKGLERERFIAAFLKEIYADSDQADQAYALVFDQEGVNETVLKRNISLLDDIRQYFSGHFIPPSMDQAARELDSELNEIERKWERFVELYGDSLDERDINFLRRWIRETRKEGDEVEYQE